MCFCTCWLPFHFQRSSSPPSSICSACTSIDPILRNPGLACVCNLSRRRIRTRAPFHRLPVRERFQPATDKGKITKPRKLPENDAHPVASSGVALPEKEDGGRRRQAPRIHGNSGGFRSHFQVNHFFLAIVYGPCGAHCRPDLTPNPRDLARSRSKILGLGYERRQQVFTSEFVSPSKSIILSLALSDFCSSQS